MEIVIEGKRFKCYEDGTVERQNILSNKWKVCPGSFDSSGYLQIGIHSQLLIKKHRLIAYAFGLLELNSELVVDHIDRNILNNRIENLRAITQQQNNFNTDAKGCFYSIRHKKWQGYIYLNKEKISLGYFKTEEEAHQKYLEAKKIYHII
jgi:hypothetical protein